jgi:hypothetical protein
MKKTMTKLAAFVLAMLMMTCIFASCAKTLSGSYEAELSLLGQGVNVTYTFSGSKVTVTSKVTILGTVNTEEIKGTYEIAETADGSLEITFDFEEETATLRDGTYTFSEEENSIKIAGVPYNKVEK